jgi:hypothetical protein
MARLIAFEAGRDVEDAAYWWVCGNDLGCWYGSQPIPAPKYDWLYHCETIPAGALLDWPELRAEYEEMWDRLPESWKRKSRHALTAGAEQPVDVAILEGER